MHAYGWLLPIAAGPPLWRVRRPSHVGVTFPASDRFRAPRANLHPRVEAEHAGDTAGSPRAGVCYISCAPQRCDVSWHWNNP
jgi:hypothetical protein